MFIIIAENEGDVLNNKFQVNIIYRYYNFRVSSTEQAKQKLSRRLSTSAAFIRC
jgi:hypothetical protein